MTKTPLWLALTPVLFLIAALSFNVLGVFGDAALEGSNQFILMLAAALAGALAMYQGTPWDELLAALEKSIASTTGSLLILLLIGALAGSWMISGIVPALIYYGLEILHPSYFLPASALICAAVALATGSSWSTSATVGIALIGIARALGISEAMAAGAVVSGAYFGDKLSPLSDTTNLAPSMAGTDIFTHIRYMLYSTVPSFALALIIFAALSWGYSGSGPKVEIESLRSEIARHFQLSPWLFAVPLGVIVLILKKVPALPALLLGTLGGVIAALWGQAELLEKLSPTAQDYGQYRLIMQALTVELQLPSERAMLHELLNSGGMAGMLPTVWLILAAMSFGGAMEAGGFLRRISRALLSLARTRFSLVATTAGTCGFLNLSASDQYLAIVVPGRMYAKAYEEMDLAPENLSRTLEDSGTVTSALVPHNTCGAYQASVLGVDTLAYLPYAYFNILSPLMTLLIAGTGWKVKTLSEEKAAAN